MILTDEEKQALLKEWDSNILLDLIEGVESTVLEKLRQQEPVAWAAFDDNGNIRIWSSASETMRKLAADEGMELAPQYAAPVPAAVPDDVAKNAARWNAMSTLMFLGNLEITQDDEGGYSISIDPAENIIGVTWKGCTPEEAIDAAMQKGGE